MIHSGCSRVLSRYLVFLAYIRLTLAQTGYVYQLDSEYSGAIFFPGLGLLYSEFIEHYKASWVLRPQSGRGSHRRLRLLLWPVFGAANRPDQFECERAYLHLSGLSYSYEYEQSW